MNLSLKKQPNSTTVESIESIETFDKRGENCCKKSQQVSTVILENIESIETFQNLSIVSMKESFAVETKRSENNPLNMFNSRFQQFQQFHWGIVGGVFL